MVFGIGEGKVEITLDKGSYGSGETINGRLSLTLNSPKKARKLRVQFYGERTKPRRGRSSSSTERIMVQEVQLDGEKEYPSGTKEYEFKFQLPNIQRPAQSAEQGLMGAITNLVTSMADPYANVRWFVDASLDLPMSMDISKKMPVNFVR
jgi:hypothetical protein